MNVWWDITLALLCAFGALVLIWYLIGMAFKTPSGSPVKHYLIRAGKDPDECDIEHRVLSLLWSRVIPFGGRIYILDAGMDEECSEIARRLSDTYGGVYIISNDEEEERL